VPPQAAASVLDRFTELGLVDDAAFAVAWVDSRHLGRGLAPRALRQELRTRGVAEETVQAAVDRIDAQAEREAAEALVRARLPGLGRYDRVTRTRRLHAMLARRGYSSSLASSVVRSALAECDEPGQE
jgi:regulatory protein